MNTNRFRRFAWGILVLNLAVIVWGAFVRATGSGAGCGDHWPLCNGQVVPRAARVETLIEFTHRITSGISLISVAALFGWSLRLFPKGHAVRRAAGASLILILTEALLGAGLVLFRYVAGNASIGRAYYLSAHLANTLLLLAAIAMTAWLASGRKPVKASPMLLAGLAATLVLGISGAVTALGDTLFPASSLRAGLEQDFSPAAHFLIRLRALHPVIAAAAGAYLIGAAFVTAARARATKQYAVAVIGLVALQMVAGFVNLILLAPVWMQLLHLLLADLLWISAVLLTASESAVRAYASVPLQTPARR